MSYRVFVDGQEGTTGLQILDRLEKIPDVEILHISQDLRKDVSARSELINLSDVTFLCLPDEAAKESASLCKNKNTILIDASTAHRTNPDWVYGLPELSREQRTRIENSKRIANPGCHATGFLLGIAPLRKCGVLKSDARLSAYSITGYSGGGKKLIAEYEAFSAQAPSLRSSPALFAPSPYALSLSHKHLPEMKLYADLDFSPHFNPILGPFYKGMAVSIALFPEMFTKKIDAKDLVEILSMHYENSTFVRVEPFLETPNFPAGRLNPTICNDTNEAKIFVFAGSGAFQVTTLIDNLGKGASGAAVQNMNIALKRPENQGL